MKTDQTNAMRGESDIVRMAVEDLRRGLGDRLVAIVLFGSQARGDANEASDWDLLVIAEGLPEKTLERHLFLKRLLSPAPRGAMSILAKTPQEFEARVSTLYLDIALDGRILYDPHGYAAKRLGSLRKMMERQGLEREHTKAGDVWRWKRQPPTPWVLDWEDDR